MQTVLYNVSTNLKEAEYDTLLNEGTNVCFKTLLWHGESYHELVFGVCLSHQLDAIDMTRNQRCSAFRLDAQGLAY